MANAGLSREEENVGSLDDQPQQTQLPAERRPATVALIVLAVLAVGAVVTYLGPILKPFLIAVFLFYTTRAAANFLIRLRFPAWLAYLTLLVVAGAATVVATVFVYREAETFYGDWPKYQERILALIGEGATGARESLEEMFQVSFADVFGYAFQKSVSVLELLLMTFFYLLFLILGAGKLPGRIRKAFPGERAQRVLSIGRQISAGMEQFMKVKTVVSLGMSLTAALVMYAFGLKHWLLWAFLFFALNYVTYIGSIVACVPPVVFAYLEFSSPVAATVLAALIVLNRVVWIDYVEIKMSGKHLNIDSVLLFLWLAYWGWAWGVLGLILAFPMITSLKIVLEHLEGTRGWAILMSED
jgi:predicted PurR-regulated permease PerM